MRERRLQRWLSRVWSSPSWTSFSSYAAQSAGVAVFLPLLLRKLPSEQVAVVLLLATVGGIRLLLDFGFSYTLMRHISYLLAPGSAVGAECLVAADLGSIKASIRRVYLVLAVLTLLLLASVGTFAVARVIRDSGIAGPAWWAWWVAVLSNAISTWGIQFGTWVQGTANVALLRRWETFFALLSPLTAAIVLFTGGGVLGVTCALASWQVIAVLRNWVLARRVNNCLWIRTVSRSPTASEWSALWAQTWRTGLGVLASFGVMQGSVIAFGRILSGEVLASFLLGFRIVSVAADASRAPFYSRTPELFRLHASGDRSAFLGLVQNGMRRSLILFVAAWSLAAWMGPWLLAQVGSRTEFPGRGVWAAFGCAFFLQRWGAMHMQVVCAANRILTHLSDGITALVYLLILPILLGPFGELALPLALSLSYAMALIPFGIWHSRVVTGLPAITFESRAAGPVLGVFATLVIAYLVIGPLR
ncbi:MAG: hypothetical protein IT580_13585 [Verrucomicrobiales bacterium]|nr:hypothetical protein [Verrucomicrobiales bacterium]